MVCGRIFTVEAGRNGFQETMLPKNGREREKVVGRERETMGERKREAQAGV